MAGPLSSIGGQQIPLATPYQPGQQGTAVRPQDEKTPKPNQVQPQGAQAAQTQKTDRNPKDLQSLLNDLKSLTSDGGESRRGSVVDITV